MKPMLSYLLLLILFLAPSAICSDSSPDIYKQLSKLVEKIEPLASQHQKKELHDFVEQFVA